MGDTSAGNNPSTLPNAQTAHGVSSRAVNTQTGQPAQQAAPLVRTAELEQLISQYNTDEAVTTSFLNSAQPNTDQSW